MDRRDFLSLGLGAAGLIALSQRSVLADNGKLLQMVRPPEGAFCYAQTGMRVTVSRKYHRNYPRIARIEFRRSGTLIQTLTETPYDFMWSVPLSALGNGDFSATAFSGSGNVIWSKSVSLLVAQLPQG